MIRRLIREMLQEDLSGFVDKTKDIEYQSDIDDPTFDAPYQKDLSNKSMAKEVKRAWAAEADHEFMKSVIKVHWVNSSVKNPDKAVDNFLNSSGRDEISTMGYLPGSQGIRSMWGDLGVIVQGRVTLAANDMENIRGGFFKGGSEKYAEKYKSSGIPRRPTTFKTKSAYSWQGSKRYILDQESFDVIATHNNEFIVDNWEPTGLIVSRTGELFLEYVNHGFSTDLSFAKAMLQHDLPIYDQSMKPIDRKAVETAVTKKTRQRKSK